MNPEAPQTDTLYQSYSRGLYKITGEESYDSIIDMLNSNPMANNAPAVETVASNIGSDMTGATSVVGASTVANTGDITANNAYLASVFYTKRYRYTAFDSLSSWASTIVGTGTGTTNWGLVVLSTSGNANDSVQIQSQAGSDFSKNPYFQTTAYVNGIACDTYVMYGDPTTYGFGFHFGNGGGSNVGAFAINNGVSTEVPLSTNGTQKHVYKAIYLGGTRINFYVDNVLLASVTSSTYIPPNNVTTNSLFTYKAKTTGAAVATLQTTELLCVQDP